MCIWLVALHAHHLPNLLVQKVFFFSLLLFKLFFFWVWWGECVCAPGVFCFKCSFCLLISAYVFMGVFILSAQVGKWLSLIVCLRHLHPVFPVPVCISKTDVPDKQFWLSLSHLNESEFFFITDFAFASVLFSGLFSLLVVLCVSGVVWFLHFSSAFTFLWKSKEIF